MLKGGPSQRSEISRWLSSQGADPESIRWFEDKETGKNLDRPAFQELEKAVFAGNVRTIIIWKLDRIARSLSDGIQTLDNWLKHNVQIVCITLQIDLSGTLGRMVGSLIFGLAEIELQHQKERQAAGIALAKQRGVYKGRKKGSMKGNPERVVKLRTEKKLTVPQIAAIEGLSERTVKSYLEQHRLTVARAKSNMRA